MYLPSRRVVLPPLRALALLPVQLLGSLGDLLSPLIHGLLAFVRVHEDLFWLFSGIGCLVDRGAQ